MNIIQIVSDTFKYHNLGCYGNKDIQFKFWNRWVRMNRFSISGESNLIALKYGGIAG